MNKALLDYKILRERIDEISLKFNPDWDYGDKWEDPYLSLEMIGYKWLSVIEKESGERMSFGYEFPEGDDFDYIFVDAYTEKSKMYQYRVEHQLERIFGIREDEDEE